MGSFLACRVGGRTPLLRLCWCASRPGVPCSTSEAFRVDVGAVSLIGPRLQQHRTCVSGQTCAVESLLGEELGPMDALQILDTCGIDGFPARLPLSGRAVHSGRGSVSWGSSPVTAQGLVARGARSPRGLASPTSGVLGDV